MKPYAIGLLAICLSNTALAQSQDLEYRTSDLENDEAEKVDVKVLFETEWHEFNNLDFRPLDESSDQAILDSDDRNSVPFTGAAIQIGVDIDDNMRFVMGASHRGLWGNDQFGTVNAFGGFAYFNAMYIDAETDSGIRFRIGRQGFSLGGVPSRLEFVYSDIVDQVRIDIPLGDTAKLIVIPINVASIAAQDDATFIGYIGQSALDTFGFRGDRLTRRHGLQLIAEDLVGSVDAQLYTFYSDLGSLGSGSDISYSGLLGNFADNDWVLNAGFRAWAQFDGIDPWLAVDASTGIDRKQLVVNDVDTMGIAISAGTDINLGDDDKGFRGQLAYFDSFGPAYSNDGLQFSHGFVGMKARHAGGTLANRYLGWHPTSYVGMFGVDSTPQDSNRKSGTRVAQLNVGYDFGRVQASLGGWFFQDTGISSVNFSEIETIATPFGYAREEFAAEQRLGKVLGEEINLDIEAEVNDSMSLYVNGAIFIPGPYYGIEIARIAGTGLGSDSPAMPWGAYAGTKVRF
jgi:hypothetical protein